MTVGRVSQAAAEVLLQFALRARLSQQTSEVLLQQQPHVRLGQQAVEILRSTAMAGGATVTQPVMIQCISG